MDLPLVVSWESTLGCNLACHHCGLNAGSARLNELKTSEAKIMFGRLKDFGVRHLLISGGEYTLRLDWQELLCEALLSFETVRMISNGFLGEKLARALHQIQNIDRFMISISLDGNQQIHDQRRGRGSFERIIAFLKHCQVRTSILTTVGKDNFADLDSILRICLENKVLIWCCQLCLPAGRMNKSLCLDEMEIKNLADLIFAWQKFYHRDLEIFPDDCFGYWHPMRPKSSWRGCHAGRRLMTILSDGSITGCPTLFDQICGNIRTDDLAEVWQGEKMQMIRNFIPLSCQGCDKCPRGCQAVQKVFGQQFCF